MKKYTLPDRAEKLKNWHTDDDTPFVSSLENSWWVLIVIFILFCLGGCYSTYPLDYKKYFSAQERYHRLTGRNDKCKEWDELDTTHVLVGMMGASGSADRDRWYDGIVVDSVHKNCLAETTLITERVVYYDSTGRAFAPPNRFFQLKLLPDPYARHPAMKYAPLQWSAYYPLK